MNAKWTIRMMIGVAGLCVILLTPKDSQAGVAFSLSLGGPRAYCEVGTVVPFYGYSCAPVVVVRDRDYYGYSRYVPYPVYGGNYGYIGRGHWDRGHDRVFVPSHRGRVFRPHHR